MSDINPSEIDLKNVKTQPLRTPVLDQTNYIEEQDVLYAEKGSDSNIPPDYEEIKLSSLGKLSAPPLLHFKDFTLEDLSNLDRPDSYEAIKGVIKALNNCCYEEFECGELHMDEAVEVFITIYRCFIGTSIEKEFYKNEDLPIGEGEGCIDHPSNLIIEPIPLNSISLRTIKDEFKEPFKIKDGVTKRTYEFRLPRLNDLLLSNELCKQIFKEEKIKFSGIEGHIKQIHNAGYDEETAEKLLNELKDKNIQFFNEYTDYLSRMGYQVQIIMNKLMLLSIDGEPFKDNIAKLNSNIPGSIWPMYNKITSDISFGVQSSVTWTPSFSSDPITRRFSFRVVDFISSQRDNENSERYEVLFD